MFSLMQVCLTPSLPLLLPASLQFHCFEQSSLAILFSSLGVHPFGSTFLLHNFHPFCSVLITFRAIPARTGFIFSLILHASQCCSLISKTFYWFSSIFMDLRNYHGPLPISMIFAEIYSHCSSWICVSSTGSSPMPMILNDFH